MTRDGQMQMIVTQMRPVLQVIDAPKEYSWNIIYRRATDPWLESTTTEWERQYHQIVRNDEYFWIWERETGDLLYTINVTGDSVLTAASELMNLLARKF